MHIATYNEPAIGILNLGPVSPPSFSVPIYGDYVNNTCPVLPACLNEKHLRKLAVDASNKITKAIPIHFKDICLNPFNRQGCDGMGFSSIVRDNSKNPCPKIGVYEVGWPPFIRFIEPMKQEGRLFNGRSIKQYQNGDVFEGVYKNGQQIVEKYTYANGNSFLW